MCFFLKWPTSCASTATNSSVVWLLINVSYRTIFFFLPIPEKNALALAERLEPSITKILSNGKFTFRAKASIAVFRSPSANGVSLLNKGNMREA